MTRPTQRRLVSPDWIGVARTLLPVAALVVSACGVPTPDGLGEVLPPVDDVAIQNVYDAVNTPLSEEEQVTLMNAQDKVVEECMQQAGYQLDYPENTVDAVFADRAYMSDFESWFFADENVAEASGYGFTIETQARSGPQESRGVVVEPEISAQEEPAMLETFRGADNETITLDQLDGGTLTVAVGGCLGLGMRSLYDDVEQYLTLKDVRGYVTNELRLVVMDADEVDSPLEEWRTCMKDAGHEFNSPPAVLESLYVSEADISPADLSEREFELAMTDAHCKQLSQLHQAAASAFLGRAQDLLLIKNAELAQLAQIEIDAIAKAQSILDS